MTWTNEQGESTPKPFRGSCRSCPAEVEMRVTGTKDDGRPRWHPFDIVNDHGSNTSHFKTCPAARQYTKGQRPPEAIQDDARRLGIPHAHQWANDGAVFEDGRMRVRQKCMGDTCWERRLKPEAP